MSTQIVKDLEACGGNFASANQYRHPSQKDNVIVKPAGRDILNLEETSKMMERAFTYLEECGSRGQVILFISSRHESLDLVRNTATSLSLPHMTVRWIGGTLSNFRNIRGRVEKMIRLRKDKDTGAWAKNTKKERVLLDRELAKLDLRFGGIENMERLPSAVFVVDGKREHIVIDEANRLNIPVISCSNTDTDLTKVQYPITINITSRPCMEYVMRAVEEAYRKGVAKKNA